MVYINLLPVREIKKRAKARSQIFTFVGIFLCLLCALGLVWFYQSSQAKSLEKDIAQLKQEKQKYAKVLAEIKKLDTEKELLEKRTGIIKQLDKTSSLTVHVLDEIANKTPSERMWLTDISQNGNSLNVSGIALDNRTVATYMEELRLSPYISNVELNTASLQTFAGRNLKSFSLSCTVTTPQEQDSSEEQEK